MIIKFLSFWSSFYTNPIYEDVKAYFEIICNKLNYDIVEVWSIFGNCPQIELSKLGKNILRIQFSGEAWYNDITKFHINLIPALESNNIIPHTLGGFHIHVHKLKFKKRISNNRQRRFCSFIVSNGGPVVRRQMFDLLSKYKFVDSLGKFNNNCNDMKIPDCDTDEYYDFLHNYKFMICFENTKTDYYLTEKLINAYAGGCIPIYWGCPQIKELLNEKAILLLEDTSEESMIKLCNKIMEIDSNEDLYKEIYEQPLINESQKQFTIEYLQNELVKKLT